jgi:hypothetical protein
MYECATLHSLHLVTYLQGRTPIRIDTSAPQDARLIWVYNDNAEEETGGLAGNHYSGMRRITLGGGPAPPPDDGKGDGKGGPKPGGGNGKDPDPKDGGGTDPKPAADGGAALPPMIASTTTRPAAAPANRSDSLPDYSDSSTG